LHSGLFLPQAGLSWSTILNKREGYRAAFKGFDPEAVAAMGQQDVEALLADPGIVRHRGKIQSTIGNARWGCGTCTSCSLAVCTSCMCWDTHFILLCVLLVPK
jgi:hypothetical protein